MTNIPDLLRMVPGAQVGQIQGGAWAVSARFNLLPIDSLIVQVSDSLVEGVAKVLMCYPL